MFPRVTHPSATPVLLRAFDLHVLSLPPAFALSQDQTLKLYSRHSIIGSVITYSHHHISRHGMIDGVHIDPSPPKRTETCELPEKRDTDRKSLVRTRPKPSPRKDPAVRVSLSSSSHCQRALGLTAQGPRSPNPTRKQGLPQPNPNKTPSPT
jgi:hypothetical protein